MVFGHAVAVVITGVVEDGHRTKRGELTDLHDESLGLGDVGRSTWSTAMVSIWTVRFPYRANCRYAIAINPPWS
jgi:hypothetical protein